MLAAYSGEVAATQAGIKDDVQPNPLTGAKRIVALIGLDVLARPGRKSISLFPLRGLYADGRVGCDVLALERPAKQALHGIQEIARRVGGAVRVGQTAPF